MILKALMAFSGVCGFGLTLLGALLGLINPYHAFVLVGFFFWSIMYATTEVHV